MKSKYYNLLQKDGKYWVLLILKPEDCPMILGQKSKQEILIFWDHLISAMLEDNIKKFLLEKSLIKHIGLNGYVGCRFVEK